LPRLRSGRLSLSSRPSVISRRINGPISTAVTSGGKCRGPGWIRPRPPRLGARCFRPACHAGAFGSTQRPAVVVYFRLPLAAGFAFAFGAGSAGASAVSDSTRRVPTI
jgi:hypothetical protein